VLATVLIANYNHGSFLADAIDSALGQTHPEVEVVVVDDGSTDGSRDVIASYGREVVALLQENRGQAGAVNAGFEVSRGEIVCLLDADDLFHEDKVARVVQAYRGHASVVHHRMQALSPDGSPIGRPAPRTAISGEIGDRVRRAGGWWPHPLTSGLSFPRWYLAQVMPIPVVSPRLFADTYLAAPAPFFGPVIGLPAVLAHNRVHASNIWTTAVIGPDQLGQRLDRLELEHAVLLETLDRCGKHVELRSARHLQLAQYRWAAGADGSALAAALAGLRCPTLPWPMKWRHLARLALRRW
jgi:glycosyltransferase involved in cell wall biosynthesis